MNSIMKLPRTDFREILETIADETSDFDDEARQIFYPKPLPENFSYVDQNIRKSEDGHIIRRSLVG